MAIAERRAEAHEFFTQGVAYEPDIKFAVAQVISAMQKQAVFGKLVNKFPKFGSQRGLVEFPGHQQVEAVFEQGVKRANEAVVFQGKYVFQKRLFNFWISVRHFSARYLTVRCLVNFVAESFDADFTIRAFKVKWVIIG